MYSAHWRVLTNKTMNQESLATQPIAEALFNVNLTEKILIRFWRKVEKLGPDECWNWKSTRSHYGHGQFSIHYKKFVSSRISFFIANGEFPNRLFVCHRCDNPSCVNPAHLFLGTQKDNIQDMMAKGRGPAKRVGNRVLGDSRVGAILTEAKVREIRSKHASGIAMRALGREYGVNRVTIRYVVKRRTWTHI